MTYMITMADLIKIIGIIFILECLKTFIVGYYFFKQIMKDDEEENKDETNT